MNAKCPRSFEAEAARDGRLGGAAAAQFLAHLKVCPECKREVQSLEALSRALRAPGAQAEADELRVRRERTRLLAAFDATLVPARGRSHLRLWVGVAATLVALVGFGLARRLARSPAPTMESTQVGQRGVMIQAGGNARWSRRTEAQRETIVLESGALSIKVDHAGSPPARLLLILPDGELEDVGTAFVVSADNGRTTGVSVQEGSVALRLKGKPALVLGAGEAWSVPIAPAAAPPPAPSASTVAVEPPPLESVRARPFGSLTAPVEGDASGEFRAAMAALDRGDSARAAALFRAFVAAHPHDSRAEDAAYLRVLSLERAGSHEAVQSASREYLARYPHGFRRAEIESLLNAR